MFEFQPGRVFKLQIWDTAGQEKYKSIAKIYYKDAKIAILVYDVTDERSFIAMQEWAESVFSITSKDILLAVVGNKTDLEDGLGKSCN